MENPILAKLSLEEIEKVAGGEINPTDERFFDLMIKLFKLQGKKMEEVYQIPGLPDDQREYIRQRWYQI